MFEIIMLFAFLGAAACQFFPERPSITREPFNKKGRHDREKNDLLPRPEQKSLTAPGPSSKVKPAAIAVHTRHNTNGLPPYFSRQAV